MSFLKRLFGSGEPKPRADIDERLAALEAEAEKAQPGYVGSAFNKAGDLALKSERPDQAVVYYGRAIDAFLEDAQREQARSVANKIIRVRPTAIRTLCTLTWLDLAARHAAMALLHLRDYVEAARAAGQQPRAATQIYLMARVSPESEFLGAVADGLDSLDFPKRAAEVRSWVDGGAPDALTDEQALAAACLESAIRSNDRDAELLSDEPEAVSSDETEAPPFDETADADEDAKENDSAPAGEEPDQVAPESAETTGEEPPTGDDVPEPAEESEADAPDGSDPDPVEAGPAEDVAPPSGAATKKGKGGGKSRKKRKKKKKR